MYTRNQGGGRQNDRKTGPWVGTGYTGGFGQKNDGIPLLIPQDYRGEFFLEHRKENMPPVSAEESMQAVSSPEDRSGEACRDDASAVADGTAEVRVEEDTHFKDGGSLLGGIYDLLIGENSTEEETLLLLAIGLLLLWGHLDRGGLFDRSTWDSDDLALLLIGYLLLS